MNLKEDLKMLISLSLYPTALWFVKDGIGVEGFIGWIIALPFTGVMVIIIIGMRAAWFFFRQTASSLEDERDES